MYAQHRSTANIPRNYSGNAFRYPPIGSLTNQSEEPITAEPTAPAEPPSEPISEPTPEPTPEQRHLTVPPNAVLPPSASPIEPPRVSIFDSGGHDLLRGITQIIGNEELLLIGLFLLLSGHTEENDKQRSDLLFYLLLLFFCG